MLHELKDLVRVFCLHPEVAFTDDCTGSDFRLNDGTDLGSPNRVTHRFCLKSFVLIYERITLKKIDWVDNRVEKWGSDQKFLSYLNPLLLQKLNTD